MTRDFPRAVTGALVVVLLAMMTVLPGFTPHAAAQTAPTTRTYTYCVQLAGVAAGEQAAFARQARDILHEVDGWTLGGTIRFAPRSSCTGTGFTLWLAAPARVDAFSPGCSAAYSCRVGRNVIINRDRWHHATPSWRNGGGSIDGYRTMVVNHEVGHWLGYGHVGCPGNGQPAPVMQQQSISLQGCRPNARPTNTERQRLASSRGVQVLGAVRHGDVVQPRGTGLRYLVEEGQRRALPDDATLRARQPTGWVRWVADRDVGLLPVGRPVPSVTRPDTATGTLLAASSDAPIDVVRSGVRHRLPDACTFDTRGYLRSDVRLRSTAQLAELPAGAPLPRACGAAVAVVPRDTAAACPADRVPVEPFVDAIGTTHADGIACIAWWEVVRGVSDDTFAPGRVLNRGQFAAMVARWFDAVDADLPEAGTPAFDDVGTSVHQRDIERLAAAGIVGGFGDRRFAPGDPVSRGQVATIVTRAIEEALGLGLPDPALDPFYDDTDTAHEFSIGRAAEAGLVGGVAVGRYAPAREVTRGELATVLARALSLMLENPAVALPDERAGKPDPEPDLDAAPEAGADIEDESDVGIDGSDGQDTIDDGTGR